MSTLFVDILETNKNLIENIITPLSPYIICNHFIATEVHSHSGWKYIDFNFRPKSNDLLVNRNYNDIKNLEIIQVQVDYLDFFCTQVLPIICKNNVKVIIITSQWHIPQIYQSVQTDNLLRNENILLWISQNPIYTNNMKYMAFPYGICHKALQMYVDFLKKNKNVLQHNNIQNIAVTNTASSVKTTKIMNGPVGIHAHLPSNHIRNVYDILGKNTGPICTNYSHFLDKIMHSEFVISTSGDRDDCYRHYECIGLDSIPVSNIGGPYKDIFGENMIYSNADEMVQMVKTNTVNYSYRVPDKDILTIKYWVQKINNRISILQQLATTENNGG